MCTVRVKYWAVKHNVDTAKTDSSCLAEAGAGALLVTAVDEVAWLLNLRGSDVSHNPVFTSYVLLQDSEATLYVDQKKVSHCKLFMHLAFTLITVFDGQCITQSDELHSPVFTSYLLLEVSEATLYVHQKEVSYSPFTLAPCKVSHDDVLEAFDEEACQVGGCSFLLACGHTWSAVLGC